MEHGKPARYPLALLCVLVAWTALLGIAPVSRSDWLLENVIVAIAVPLLVFGYGRLRFSALAYGALFVFFMLHEVGAHYTYSEVPYDRWVEAAFGTGLNPLLGFERNHFDRLVHLSYGLLLAPCAVELLDARAPPRGLWRWLLPVLFIMSHSVLYETVEWLAAEVFGGDLGQAFLGTQGDQWDAQKDMALAMLGAAISVTWLRASRAARRPRDR